MVAQIELSKRTSTSDILMTHGIYTTHSSIDEKGNTIVFTVWKPGELSTDVSVNEILTILGNDEIHLVHILPMKTDSYSIGNDEKRWLLTTGSQMFNDTAETKSIELYSGR